MRPPASAWLGSSRLVYGTQPIIAANWKVSQHNTWAVPFGWAFRRCNHRHTSDQHAARGLLQPDSSAGFAIRKMAVRFQTALLVPKAK